jgi:hypothetical protein
MANYTKGDIRAAFCFGAEFGARMLLEYEHKYREEQEHGPQPEPLGTYLKLQSERCRLYAEADRYLETRSEEVFERVEVEKAKRTGRPLRRALMGRAMG